MKRIMALIDFSDVTPAVVKMARDIALAFNSELLLVHVIVPRSELAEDEIRDDDSAEHDVTRFHHRQLEILKIALGKEGINAVPVVVPSDRPQNHPTGKILAEITRLSPDLVVIGSHSHGWLHQLIAGSVTDGVARKSHCPVLIVPSRKAEIS
jgi:nucleotide-binding universal stress UspA family protein